MNTNAALTQALAPSWRALAGVLLLSLLALLALPAIAHDVSQQNARYIESISGIAPVPFAYLGAKHMVTGIDHVLFLIGVVFFLRHFRDVLVYVSLFTLGHSITLLGGVLGGWHADARIVDAIIGLSVVYKAFDNIGGFDRMPFPAPDPKWAVAAFGLAHGTGLATKLQALTVSRDGLFANMISFNFGVELGQVLVLAFIVSFLNIWRKLPGFERQAWYANIALMIAGFVLFGRHAFAYFSGVQG